MKPLHESGIVKNLPVCRRILNQSTEERGAEVPGVVIANDYIDPERFRTGFHYGYGLRMTGIGHKKCPSRRLLPERKAHRPRLCSRRSLVQQRRVCNLEPGKVCYHRLEVHEGFQTSL